MTEREYVSPWDSVMVESEPTRTRHPPAGSSSLIDPGIKKPRVNPALETEGSLINCVLELTGDVRDLIASIKEKEAKVEHVERLDRLFEGSKESGD
jgi:hypothetical protein